MEQEIKTIKKKDGKLYTIKPDPMRFFFPNEWTAFFNSLREKNKRLFDFMINTGARFNEAIHIRPIDFDFDRNIVRLWKTKIKAKKGEEYGKPRTISLSTEYAKRIRRICMVRPPSMNLFYQELTGFNTVMKGHLKKMGVKDYYNFSSHNIRKTHGMYLKALGIDIAEICTRLGHDHDTYIKHYGSADVFSEKDMRKIKEILGDLYSRRRRY